MGLPPGDNETAQQVVRAAAFRAAGSSNATFHSTPLAAVLPPKPSVLLQGILTFGAKTAEGRLIEIVAPPWYKIIELLERDPAVMYQMTSEQWEHMVAGAYSKAGFEEVIVTPRSGDRGIDVIAVKHGIGTVRIIDQVKAYRPGHLVTADDVRALLGVLHADNASKGFLTTTSDFAPKLPEDILLKPYIPSRLELVNGEKLLARLKELREISAGLGVNDQ